MECSHPDKAWETDPRKAVWRIFVTACALTTLILLQLALPLALPRVPTVVSSLGMKGMWPFLGHPLSLQVVLSIGQPLMRWASKRDAGLFWPSTMANMILCCTALFWTSSSACLLPLRSS